MRWIEGSAARTFGMVVTFLIVQSLAACTASNKGDEHLDPTPIEDRSGGPRGSH